MHIRQTGKLLIPDAGELPWQSSGWNSALSLMRAWISELRSCKPGFKVKKQPTNKKLGVVDGNIC